MAVAEGRPPLCQFRHALGLVVGASSVPGSGSAQSQAVSSAVVIPISAEGYQGSSVAALRPEMRPPMKHSAMLPDNW